MNPGAQNTEDEYGDGEQNQPAKLSSPFLFFGVRLSHLAVTPDFCLQGSRSAIPTAAL